MVWHIHSIYEFFRESPPHNSLPMCPTSLQARCITEDVGGTLVSWHSLGKLVGIKTVALNSIINLAGLLNQTNYFKTGINLEHLNLHDKTLDEVKVYVKNGKLEFNPVLDEVYFPFGHFVQPCALNA
jgi:hypothetical protein